MLGQNKLNSHSLCSTYKGFAHITGAHVKRTKIIDSIIGDFFEQLFLNEEISDEHWKLIKKIRRLAFHARRSQGIRMRLQSHSQYWGMPHVCSNDGYENAHAERRWKLFLLYVKPYIEHEWLDAQMLELLLFGGHVLCDEDVSSAHTQGTIKRIASAHNLQKRGIKNTIQSRTFKQPQSSLERLGLTRESVHQALLVIEYVYEKTYRRR